MIPIEFINAVKHFEGFQAKPYRCPSGKLTVGYGHTIRIPINLTEQEATSILVADLVTVYNQLFAKYKWFATLLPHEQLAFVDLVFNIGIGNFSKTSFDNKVKTFYHFHKEVIADHFDSFIYSSGKVLRGLVNRRKFEHELFMTGSYVL